MSTIDVLPSTSLLDILGLFPELEVSGLKVPPTGEKRYQYIEYIECTDLFYANMLN